MTHKSAAEELDDLREPLELLRSLSPGVFLSPLETLIEGLQLLPPETKFSGDLYLEVARKLQEEAEKLKK